MIIEATPINQPDLHGSICYFVGHVGGRQDSFLNLSEDHGYSLNEPLVCPITGQELGEYGYSDSRGNTGSLYFRPVEVTEEDAVLCWYAFSEGVPEFSYKEPFLKWLCALLGDHNHAKTLANCLEWSDKED